jgi:hypothetical protein
MIQNLFTASQIAHALGMKRQAVRRVLANVPPGGQVIVFGVPADAWTVCALPALLQELLAAEAKRLGLQSPEQLLRAPAKRWESAVPFSEVAQHCLDKAAKLQRALAGILRLRDDPTTAAADRERVGLDDYRKEFSFPITARHLHRLIDRTLDRDGGAGEFGRLELYLDDNLARKHAAGRGVPLSANADFRELQEVVATFTNPAAPTQGEKQYLWLRAFDLREELTATGRNPKKVKNSLLKALFSCAPFLAATHDALRQAFNRKHARWIANDQNAGTLADGRKDNSGFHRAPELTAADSDALIGHAVLNCDGRVSQAWRELSERGALSEELLGYYLSNPASKSHCPARIRDAVKYEVAMMDDIHHGPRQDKLNGAHLSRDWSAVASMDWLCADDATLEVYFYAPDGKGWFTLMRGQFLVFIDVRSLCVLGFALQPERNYNARTIRTLITRVCDEHGLPRRGFYFERGIWKSSRLLKGDAKADPSSWGETELGLRSLGLEFRHSKLPRSKPVERVIGALQDLCEGEPGYVGRDEMHERFERVQKAKLEVAARKAQPSDHFYSLDEWVARLEEICNRYNSTAQNGKMTCDLSPDEAFVKFTRAADPVIKLPASCRYLLAHHKRPLKVTSNGITLRFGKQAFNYRDEATGRLRGKTVLAWFNPELPEILTVTDMNRENAFCVERSQDVPAMDCPEELLGQELARIEAHQSYARVRYRMLKSKFATPFRRVIADAATVELGTRINAEQTRVAAARSQEQRQQGKLRKLSRGLNMAISDRAARRPETAPALERLTELMNEVEEEST